jgi:23S rRNA (guanosine2251-2'-O)-methyltransferase
MIVYGYHPVREALRRRPHEVRRVLIAGDSGRGAAASRRREIEALCRRRGVAVEALPAAELTARAGPAHNGFAAEVAVPAAAAGERPDPDLVVLVEDVQDPRNLGALLRVAEGAGAARVLVRDRGSAPLSPAAAKTAAGAGEWLPLERVTNSAQTIERLKADGFWVYGAAAGGEPPWTVDLTGRVALVFGGEERGLRRRTRELCDKLIGLPMRGRVASLNLATAAAALLYEAVRQRTAAGGGGPAGSRAVAAEGPKDAGAGGAESARSGPSSGNGSSGSGGAGPRPSRAGRSGPGSARRR